MRVCRSVLSACFFVVLLAAASHADDKFPRWQFRLSFPKEVRAESFNGRVVLYCSQTRCSLASV